MGLALPYAEAMQPVLYALHMIGLAGIVVGYVLLRARGVTPELMVWSARLQLLIGLAQVGYLSSQGAEMNHVWVAIKLLVALAVVACCEIGRGRHRRADETSALRMFDIAVGLTLVNAAVAWALPH